MTALRGFRETREATGLSLREIARRTGLNPGRLSIIERGFPPTDDERRALNAALAEAGAPTPTVRKAGATR